MKLVLLGISITGPTPQIRPLAPGFFGEKKKFCTTSPMPLWLPSPSPGTSCLTTGMMVREMMFQSSFRLIGTTGWMFSVVRLPSRLAPMSRSKLN